MKVSPKVKFKFAPQTHIGSLQHFCDHVILIDLSWLLHRSFYSYANLSVTIKKINGNNQSMGQAFANPAYGFDSVKKITEDEIIVFTGDFYGTLKTIINFAEKRPSAAIILCMDAPNPEKKELLTEYKANRGDRGHIYAKLFEIVTTACLLPNVYVSYYDRKEADDLIYNLAQTFSKVMKVLIYATDRDLFQSITNDNISMSSKYDVEFKKDFVSFTYGVPPEKLSFLRSICSLDTSDNIKAYARFPRKLAKKIVNAFENPRAFLASNFVAETTAQQRWVHMLKENPEVMLRLYKVHSIQPIPDLQISRVPNSYEYLDKYRCVSIKSKINRLLEIYTDIIPF